MMLNTPVIPIAKVDMDEYDFWLFTADDGQKIYGPAVYKDGKRLGQLILVAKGEWPENLP